MKLIFATHNTHKVKELNQLLPHSIELLSLNEIGCHQEIIESGKTLEENAKIKADFIRYKYGLDCFADDSGLEIEALNGAPGVYSARYAGAERDMEKNIQKVWEDLAGKETAACFRTVFFLHLEGREHLLTGRVAGRIIFEKRGSGGFGYDPIFIPEGQQQTFGELGAEIKNKIGHRAQATKALLNILSPKLKI